ncbi:hypothetical protein BASA83_004064 [Batrachochytrium salamandrivorans]|nr:hypothetical protein BASA83_004064 [Batrachochytrium salamandrivorans]
MRFLDLAWTALVLVIGNSIHAQLMYRVSECRGIYGPKDTSSYHNGSISVKISPFSNSGSIAISILNYLDSSLIARNPFTENEFICTQTGVNLGQCQPNELGKLHFLKPSESGYHDALSPILNERILWVPPSTPINAIESGLKKRQQSPNQTLPTSAASNVSTATAALGPTLTTSFLNASPLPSATASVHFATNSTFLFQYEVPVAGMYCVLMLTQQQKDVDYNVEIIMAEPYGLLPGLFYPALIFYGVISMAYLLVGIIWMSLSFRYWADLLPIQHFVSGVIAFLIIEMALNFGLYDSYNSSGVVSVALMVIVAIFNSGRISLSFFMLLIVALGYGVVKPTLGDTMKRCIGLTAIHFAFGVAYAIAALLSVEKNAILVVAVTLPLSLTMMVFYVWIFTGITETMQRLELRRQSVKLLMYERLGYILSTSAVAILAVAVANSVNFSYRNDPQWISTQWKWRWMLLDGSMNAIYFIVFVCIMLLWRPTENNQRYGLDQLAQDDPDEDINGIKLHDVLHGPDDLDDFDDEFGQFHDDGMESADEVLRWVEQNVGSTNTYSGTTNSQPTGSKSHHVTAATGVGLGELGARSRNAPQYSTTVSVVGAGTHARLPSEDTGLPDAHSSDKLI